MYRVIFSIPDVDIIGIKSKWFKESEVPSLIKDIISEHKGKIDRIEKIVDATDQFKNLIN